MDQLYFPELITLDLRTLWWHSSLIFFHFVSQSDDPSQAYRKGIELGFRANTWRLNFAG